MGSEQNGPEGLQAELVVGSIPVEGGTVKGGWCSHLEHPFRHQMFDKNVKIVVL